MRKQKCTFTSIFFFLNALFNEKIPPLFYFLVSSRKGLFYYRVILAVVLAVTIYILEECKKLDQCLSLSHISYGLDIYLSSLWPCRYFYCEQSLHLFPSFFFICVLLFSTEAQIFNNAFFCLSQQIASQTAWYDSLILFDSQIQDRW